MLLSRGPSPRDTGSTRGTQVDFGILHVLRRGKHKIQNIDSILPLYDVRTFPSLSVVSLFFLCRAYMLYVLIYLSTINIGHFTL